MPEAQQIILDVIDKQVDSVIDAAFDTSYRVLEKLKINLYENQIEIVEAIADLEIDKIAIAQARAAGKTFGVEIGLILLALDIPGIRIGITAPKEAQASRLLKELQTILKGTLYEGEVLWDLCSGTKCYFKNGSSMIAISGSKTAEIEGHHFDVLVVDEAHRLSSFSFENKLLPMLGGSEYGKIIKLGVTMFKGHFWRSCKPNSGYLKLIRDWRECPFLLRGGSIIVDGVEYAKFVIDRMPLSLKEKYFPNNPELHYEGDMSLIDFLTQYEMEWVDDLSTFLGEKETDLLVGDHKIATKAHPGSHYFFGLDTQKGTLEGTSEDLDYTALSIWEKTSDNVKKKVACYEWQENPLDQQEEIEQIITEIFPCDFGLTDFSNNAVMMLEHFKRLRIPAWGITYQAKDKDTGLNYKNAMFTHFLFELRAKRCKYPEASEIEQDVVFNKHFVEWCMLEKIRKLGINDDIRAPEGEHDDGPNSDALAVYAADKAEKFKVGRKHTRRINLTCNGLEFFNGKLTSFCSNLFLDWCKIEFQNDPPVRLFG